MEKLTIKADHCVIEKSDSSVKINGAYINDLILENLPQGMGNYKPYAASLNISLDIELGDLSVETTGYKKEGGDTNDNTNNSDSSNE